MPKQQYLANHTGTLLSERRKSLKMVLEDVAHEVGVEPPTIHRYESGKSKPQDKYVSALARVLKIDVDVLADAIKKDRFIGDAPTEPIETMPGFKKLVSLIKEDPHPDNALLEAQIFFETRRKVLEQT